MADPTSPGPYTPIGDEPSGIATLIRRVLPVALLALVFLLFAAMDSALRATLAGLARLGLIDGGARGAA